MKLTQRAIDLVKEFEGLRLDAYRDPVGIVTIGYGYTNRAGFGPGVNMGDEWTEKQAEDMLRQGLEMFAEKIQPHIKAPITDNQFGAFVSLSYNIGWQSFIKSTALKRFNQGDALGAADAMLWWNKAGGKVLRGLTRRRQAEVDLFLSATRADAAEGGNARPDKERTSMTQSKTVQAVGVGSLAALAPVFTSIGDLDRDAQIVLIAGACVSLMALAFIFRERLKKWQGGIR